MERREKNEPLRELPRFVSAEMRDSGAVIATCPLGHRSLSMVQSTRHDVLFTSGTLAFLDGYYNEAVSTMAAALERAYEYFIRIALRGSGLDSLGIDDFWRGLGSQSERQFGAFLVLWRVHTKSRFPPDDDERRFRNSIIHRGHLPSADETYQWASKTFARIKLISAHVHVFWSKEAQDELLASFDRQRADVPDLPASSFMTVGIDDLTTTTISAWFDLVRQQQEVFRSLVSLP